MTASASETVAPARRALIVFDYDLSLVDDDCDVFFLRQLCPELLAEVAATLQGKTPPTWPGLLDEVLADFSARLPTVTRDEMQRTVAQIPVADKMLDAVKSAVDDHGATVVIVSDANDLFIRSMLAHRGLDAYFAEVHTNRAEWEHAHDEQSNRLRLRPYHPLESEPHGCEWCPTNMCKGRIVDEIRRKGDYDVVLYVGDGSGDFCPSTRLTSNDIVFARAHGADGKSYGLLEKLEKHRAIVQARVVEWHSADDIYDHFQCTLAGHTPSDL